MRIAEVLVEKDDSFVLVLMSDCDDHSIKYSIVDELWESYDFAGDKWTNKRKEMNVEYNIFSGENAKERSRSL